MVRGGLVWETYCAPLTADVEEIVEAVIDGFKFLGWEVRHVAHSRLFGGWKCEFDDRVHLIHAVGHYDYSNINDSRILFPQERVGIWRDLCRATKPEWGFIGAGHFCDDYPQEVMHVDFEECQDN
jgi:hypothetical protein